MRVLRDTFTVSGGAYHFSRRNIAVTVDRKA